MENTNTWTKLKITRGNKEALICFSKGNAKYIRFTSTFMKNNDLKDMNSVNIYLKKRGDIVMIGFEFKSDETGMLKLGINERGVGNVSGSSLFTELQQEFNIDRKRYKKGFSAKEEKMDGNKILVIQLEE